MAVILRRIVQEYADRAGADQSGPVRHASWPPDGVPLAPLVGALNVTSAV